MKRLHKSVGRDVSGVPCDCGGYAERVVTTEEERKRFGCGHDSETSECCARAFLCRICKERLAGSAESPEMDW